MGQLLTAILPGNQDADLESSQLNCNVAETVAELQRRLETNEQELVTSRQRVADLQCRLETNEQELITSRQTVTALRTRYLEEVTTREQFGEMLRSNEHEMKRMSDRRDWVMKRNEIQIMTDQKLGEGAWGIVYRGKFHGCDVAVKEMHPNIMSDHNRYLFEREVDMASRCRHPCLLLFIGATTEERPLLVTEIMECSLRARLYNTGKQTLSAAEDLSSEEVCVISLDVARALNYLHQKSEPIIHHDISSANVLLWQQGDQWRAKVSDYGTANFVRQSNINYAGAVIYCAPESLNEDPDQPISCKVDVYSFGVLLCEMCIRQEPEPYRRELQIAQIQTHKFQNLVIWCLQRDPWERPNMELVIEELERSDGKENLELLGKVMDLECAQRIAWE